MTYFLQVPVTKSQNPSKESHQLGTKQPAHDPKGACPFHTVNKICGVPTLRVANLMSGTGNKQVPRTMSGDKESSEGK